MSTESMLGLQDNILPEPSTVSFLPCSDQIFQSKPQSSVQLLLAVDWPRTLDLPDLKSNKTPFTPVVKQIITSLDVAETSHLKKSCQETSHNLYNQKFSMQSSLRNAPKSFVKKLSREHREKLEMNDSLTPRTYTRVQRWIRQNDFKVDENEEYFERGTLSTWDLTSDITSVSRVQAETKYVREYDDIKVEERTDVVKFESTLQPSHYYETSAKPVSKINLRSTSALPPNFRIPSNQDLNRNIAGESECPLKELRTSDKSSEFSFKSIETRAHQPSATLNCNLLSTIFNYNQPLRLSNRGGSDYMVPKTQSMYYSWSLFLMKALIVGTLLIIFDRYINPEEYFEPAPSSYLDYLLEYLRMLSKYLN